MEAELSFFKDAVGEFVYDEDKPYRFSKNGIIVETNEDNLSVQSRRELKKPLCIKTEYLETNVFPLWIDVSKYS